MNSLIECIPNFSEGRNLHAINSLSKTVTAAPGVALLDEHHDADHHRCVLTFAGNPDALAKAAFNVVKTATELIDLREHIGQHPRIGTTDVLPFIPLQGSTMKDCIKLARQVGARIGNELQIPVFLYEESCEQLKRKSLEVIRRGGLKELTLRMKTDGVWAPDFGPPEPHYTAGVIVVGARYPLIACNVVLGTSNLSIAKDIAKKIRTSGGGLPALKALGLEMQSEGYVQVSMNLTNFHQTSIPIAFEAVKQEAERRGVTVEKSEVIGLIPEEAAIQVDGSDIQFDWLKKDKTLEYHMRQSFEL